MSKPGKVLPWSYSSLSAFETCPRRYHLTRITREVSEPQTEATLWGNQVHQALEYAVKGTKALEPAFTAYQPIVDRIRAADGRKFTEQKFGLTNSFTPTTFFGKDVWFRGVIDLQVVREKTALAFDYKTGKVRTDGDQLKLFAAATFAQHPHIEKVHTQYLWLAHDKTTGETFHRDDLPSIWQDFVPRINRMTAAQDSDRWMPSPSGLCNGWCPVGPDRCEFWKPKREARSE